MNIFGCFKSSHGGAYFASALLAGGRWPVRGDQSRGSGHARVIEFADSYRNDSATGQGRRALVKTPKATW